MVKNLVSVFALVVLLASCGSKTDDGKTDVGKDSVKKVVVTPNSKEGILAKISEAEKKASMAGTNAADKTLAQNLINAYNEYVMFYPDDTLAKKYAFQSASVAINTYNNEQAIVLIDNFNKNYPDKERKLQFLVLKAMIYDDRIQDKTRAKEVYEQIIKEYPNSPAAQQAKDAIKLLGKSDLEMIREMEKKNGVVK
ncbi:MAG: tetratricopeptide repeat protein [Bacteroidia bacterium]|nr:tetratricopeptide repeat protein [Bacteroidia bacterium]